MRILALLMVVISLAFAVRCDDYDPPIDVGTITGPDLRLCPCCGGYWIDFEDTTYRFYALPANSNINLPNETYPIKVLVKWEPSAFQCLGDEIDLETLIKLQ